MDDCFEDMDEPMYGFRSKVMLTENSPCELGVTCRGVPEDDSDTTYGNYGTGYSYQDGSYIPESSTRDSYDSLVENEVERQTGEDFSSDGPPDCRVTFDPNQCRRI